MAPTPVLAAGGIADGRQIAAALALGAQGVWCGSVWLTTEEAETHPVVKEKFLAATSADTLRSRAKTGKPARQLRSSWTDEWADPANPDPLGMPLQMILVGEAEARIARSAGSSDGARRLINYFVGQAVGQMNESKSATQVVFDFVEGYVDAAERLAATIADVVLTAPAKYESRPESEARSDLVDDLADLDLRLDVREVGDVGHRLAGVRAAHAGLHRLHRIEEQVQPAMNGWPSMPLSISNPGRLHHAVDDLHVLDLVVVVVERAALAGRIQDGDPDHRFPSWKSSTAPTVRR